MAESAKKSMRKESPVKSQAPGSADQLITRDTSPATV